MEVKRIWSGRYHVTSHGTRYVVEKAHDGIWEVRLDVPGVPPFAWAGSLLMAKRIVSEHSQPKGV